MRTFTRTLAIAAAIASLVATSAIAASASATAAEKSPATLIVRDLPAQVRLVPGEKVKIVLSTNRTTGYSWQAEGGCCTRDDKQIARVSKGAYKAPDASTGLVGAPGTTTWTVTALRPGTTDITIVTRPPGAKNTMSDEEVGELHLIVHANP